MSSIEQSCLQQPLWRAVVNTILALSGATRAAYFLLDDSRWRLAWSDHVAQVDVTTPAVLTPAHCQILYNGDAVVLTDPHRLVVPGSLSGSLTSLLVVRLPIAANVPARYLPVLGELLGLGSLPRGATAPCLTSAATAPDDTDTRPGDRAELLRVLDRHEWNIARVARLLGVTRMTVYNRMRRLGVVRRKVRKQSLARHRVALHSSATAIAEAAHA